MSAAPHSFSSLLLFSGGQGPRPDLALTRPRVSGNSPHRRGRPHSRAGRRRTMKNYLLYGLAAAILFAVSASVSLWLQNRNKDAVNKALAGVDDDQAEARV